MGKTQINRRSFLKGLCTSSAIMICPALLGKTIDETDKILTKEPLIFDVQGSGGELSLSNYWAPPTRLEAYELSLNSITKKQDLLDEAGNITAMRAEIYNYSHDNFEDNPMEDWGDEDVETFVRGLSDKEFTALREHLTDWLESELYETDDDETAPYNHEIRVPLNGSAAAFRLFGGYDHGEEFEPTEVAEMFKINLIEGEHPGSTYYAAELSMPVEEANKLAEEKEIPIRFIQV